MLTLLLFIGGFLFIFGFIAEISVLQTIFYIYLVVLVICVVIAIAAPKDWRFPTKDKKRYYTTEDERRIFDSELNNFRHSNHTNNTDTKK